MRNIYTEETGHPLMIRTLRQLDGAGDSNTDRMITYSRDMDVLRYHVRSCSSWSRSVGRTRGFTTGTWSWRGWKSMEPGAMRYRDNI